MTVQWQARDDHERGPLSGFRVLDFSELLPGPFLTQSLVELGADVIKIERPPHGDNTRRVAPGLFAAINRGKRSLLADLKSEQQLAAVRALADDADVLVESYRPGVMARLGLGPQTLLAANPRLVFASLSGYGAHGVRAAWPGHDINYLAASGSLALSGGEVGVPALPIADLGSAVYALAAINAALLQRARTGRGQWLDISFTDCLAHWMNPRLANFRHNGANTLERQRALILRPGYGSFTCRDGLRISIGALEDHFWCALVGVLCDVIDFQPFDGEAYLALHARSAEAPAINARIAQAMATLSRDDAMRALLAADVPASEVLEPLELPTHPPFVERGLYTPTETGALCRFPIRMQGMTEPPGRASLLDNNV